MSKMIVKSDGATASRAGGDDVSNVASASPGGGDVPSSASSSHVSLPMVGGQPSRFACRKVPH